MRWLRISLSKKGSFCGNLAIVNEIQSEKINNVVRNIQDFGRKIFKSSTFHRVNQFFQSLCASVKEDKWKFRFDVWNVLNVYLVVAHRKMRKNDVKVLV